MNSSLQHNDAIIGKVLLVNSLQQIALNIVQGEFDGAKVETVNFDRGPFKGEPLEIIVRNVTIETDQDFNWGHFSHKNFVIFFVKNLPEKFKE